MAAGYQTHLYIYGDHTFIGDRAQDYSQWLGYIDLEVNNNRPTGGIILHRIKRARFLSSIKKKKDPEIG